MLEKLEKFTIATRYLNGAELELYYSFDSELFEVSDRGAVIDQSSLADPLALRHGFTDNSKRPISPFLPPLLKVKAHGNPILRS